MPKKKLYLYDAYNKKWRPDDGFCPGALLTFPISSLYHIKGCAFSYQRVLTLLVKKNIGKKFDIEFLDPVRVKNVRFCGRVLKGRNQYLPNYIYKYMVDNDFFKFKSSFFVFRKEKEYIVVNANFIDAELVK